MSSTWHRNCTFETLVQLFTICIENIFLQVTTWIVFKKNISRLKTSAQKKKRPQSAPGYRARRAPSPRANAMLRKYCFSTQTHFTFLYSYFFGCQKNKNIFLFQNEEWSTFRQSRPPRSDRAANTRCKENETSPNNKTKKMTAFLKHYNQLI